MLNKMAYYVGDSGKWPSRAFHLVFQGKWNPMYGLNCRICLFAVNKNWLKKQAERYEEVKLGLVSSSLRVEIHAAHQWQSAQVITQGEMLLCFNLYSSCYFSLCVADASKSEQCLELSGVLLLEVYIFWRATSSTVPPFPITVSPPAAWDKIRENEYTPGPPSF